MRMMPPRNSWRDASECGGGPGSTQWRRRGMLVGHKHRTGEAPPMQIDAVDFFYLSMPEVTTEGDGSQDALLVRVAPGGHVGWGAWRASPLASIAAAICPRSHGACQPVLASVLGERFDGVDDIARTARL